jgi:hypothetical protein
VAVRNTWEFYLHTDGQVKLSAFDYINDTTGYFETHQEATTARIQYYASYDIDIRDKQFRD